MRRLLYVIVLIVCVVACKRMPDHVIAPDDMAALLVDIHKGEAVIDLQHARYFNDSTRNIVRRSVLTAHGVTQEQFDSSLAWYGRHMDEYLKVYDQVIARLEDDLDEYKRSLNQPTAFAVGDSVDIWPLPSTWLIDHRSPSRIITFAVTDTALIGRAGNYHLQYHVDGSANDIHVRTQLLASYTDNTIEYRNMQSNVPAWIRLRLVTDSTRALSAVYGRIELDDVPQSLYIDSITLVRTPPSPVYYRSRSSQRIIKAPTDTLP